MTSRRVGRVQACDREEAETRLAHARKFLEVAELVATEEDQPQSSSVAAAVAVLAGIAAADAACCATLARRSRGQDHHQAEQLLAEIDPGGREASLALGRLMALKDTAHYGLIHVSAKGMKASLRLAQKLLTFAEAVMRA